MWPFRRPRPAPSEPRGPTIRLTVVNGRSGPISVALEPLGYCFDVPPTQSRGAEFTPSTLYGAHLEITVDEDGITVWEASGDGRGLSPEGGHHGAEGPP